MNLNSKTLQQLEGMADRVITDADEKEVVREAIEALRNTLAWNIRNPAGAAEIHLTHVAHNVQEAAVLFYAAGERASTHEAIRSTNNAQIQYCYLPDTKWLVTRERDPFDLARWEYKTYQVSDPMKITPGLLAAQESIADAHDILLGSYAPRIEP